MVIGLTYVLNHSENKPLICSHLSIIYLIRVSLKNIYWLVEIVHIDDAIRVKAMLRQQLY